MALSDGDYYIVNGYAPELYMDVVHGNRNNGANVRVWHKDATDNQVWQVSTRADGSRQITSRFTGKSIDVKSDLIEVSGTNVQMYTNHDGRNQKWDIEDTGTTITIGGEALPLYKVVLTDAPSMCAELYGNTGFDDGSNVCIARYGGAADQKWAFVPVPPFESGGVYELALRLDPRYALDVASGSPANGANCILTGRHNANDHKFYLTERTAGRWTLRNIASGKFVQVAHGTAAALTNVEQWQLQNKIREEWKPVAFGTMQYQGAERTIVRLFSWVDDAGNTFVMDANQNAKLDLGNICITNVDPDDQGQYSQQWLMIPTRATDPNMAIPADLGWSAYVGDPTHNRDRAATETLYPTWTCTDAWATAGPNHYEWRYRSRLMDGTTSTYGAWGEWVDWSTALVTQQGQQAWVTEGLPATFDGKLYKVLEYQFEVRTVGVGETAAVQGEAASTTIRSMFEPDAQLSKAGFSANGLRMDYRSDYTNGTNVLTITSIQRNGVELLSKTLRYDRLDSSTSVSIGITDLRALIEDGDTITVTWVNGTDQWAQFDTEHSADLVVSYDAGYSEMLEPEVTMDRGRIIHVELDTQLPKTAVYIRTEDGKIRSCPKKGAYYEVSYPFGESFDIFASAVSNGQDQWELWHQRYTPADGLLRKYPACHAWSWAGGSFLLELTTRYLETDRSLGATFEAIKLDSREFESVYFAKTISSDYTATGILYHGLTENDRADLMALMKARHVVYRSPHGEVVNVAITDIKYKTHLDRVRGEFTEVNISMTQETL